MKTESAEYKEHLEKKYLFGRRFYLQHFFYPKIIKSFKNNSPILDLGCGMGEFLLYCQKINRIAKGVDSNEFLVNICKQQGLDATLDNVCNMQEINHAQYKNYIIDNVLEHLSTDELHTFFQNITNKLSKGSIICVIVPGKKGFQRDPTHKTFIDFNLLNQLAKPYQFEITKTYYHPVNTPFLGTFFYLNMTVFLIERQ